jgi:hypothetical protein
LIEWHDIPGWNAEYQISNDGQVKRRTLTYRNKYSPVVLVKTAPNGYKYCWLGGQSGKNFYIHRLVAFSFVGPQPSDSHEVAHWDGNRANNHFENLRWATRSENMLDMRRHGTHKRLTVAKVKDIRARLEHTSRTELAKEFGCTYQLIAKIARNELWRDIN